MMDMERKNQTQFYIIRDHDNRQFIMYNCRTCKRPHTYETDGKTIELLLRAKRLAKELVLWCGEGKPPRLSGDDGLAMKVAIKNAVSKKQKVKIKRAVKEIEWTVNGQLKGIEAQLRTDLISLKFKLQEKLERMEGILEGSIRELYRGL